jgi:hypothetical protein
MPLKSVSVPEALEMLAEAITTGRAIKMKLVYEFNGHSKIHALEQIPQPYPRPIRHWIPFWEDKKRWPDECVDWDGRTRDGYGLIRFANHKPEQTDIMSHRVAHLFARKKIEMGLVIHHQCNNRLCVNPKHLEAMDRSKNATLGLARHHGIIDD